ncbi:MAG TPA: hypothetical protein VFC63_07915 [Blastocatellia bacterium]|nr:hypothetical protein [Blastocatellia bacterium]
MTKAKKTGQKRPARTKIEELAGDKKELTPTQLQNVKGGAKGSNGIDYTANNAVNVTITETLSR